MNKCENARSFNAPKQASIDHGLDQDVVILARAIDTIGSAYVSLNTQFISFRSDTKLCRIQLSRIKA